MGGGDTRVRYDAGEAKKGGFKLSEWGQEGKLLTKFRDLYSLTCHEVGTVRRLVVDELRRAPGTTSSFKKTELTIGRPNHACRSLDGRWPDSPRLVVGLNLDVVGNFGTWECCFWSVEITTR